MGVSASFKLSASPPHLMLHRNIDAYRGPRTLDRSACHRRPRLLTVRSTSATLSKLHPKLHRKVAAGRSCPAVGEDIVVGIDSIIIMLIVGAIAGWLAGQIGRGFGFRPLWKILIGNRGPLI